MRTIAALLLLLAALPAAAADEPDAVYTRYHRAAVTRDLDEMLRYAAAAQRAEIAAMSAAQRDALGKMLEVGMPRAFLLKKKTLTPDGKGARLLLAGPGGSVLDAKSEALYGTVTLVNERGEWKVVSSDWNTSAPAELQSAAKDRPASPQKPAAAPRGAPQVGSANAMPERKLGIAKEPCVYKPVMTAEDIENCR